MSSVLVGPSGMDVILVDHDTDDFFVTVTAEHYREKGSPESALEFAKRLRREHGAQVEDLACAIEKSARDAIIVRTRKNPRRFS